MKEVEGCKGEEEMMLLLLKKDAYRLPFSHLRTHEQMCWRIHGYRRYPFLFSLWLYVAA